MAATLQELADRARQAIEREEDFVFEVAGEACQMFDNVKHMRWFRVAVALWLTENVHKWEHLYDAMLERSNRKRV